MPTRLVHLIFV